MVLSVEVNPNRPDSVINRLNSHSDWTWWSTRSNILEFRVVRSRSKSRDVTRADEMAFGKEMAAAYESSIVLKYSVN